MSQGIYTITFRGASDWGIGMLVLQNGNITGADVGGATYDGTYTDNGDSIFFKAIMTVPPGVSLVQGTRPMPTTYTVPFEAEIKKNIITTGEPVLINLPPGPVNVIFKKLRTL